MKATLEDYKNVHNENPEVFNKTILRFRECMCSTKYSVEEKDEMFYSLTQDYLRLKLNESQIQFFMTTKREWEIRSSYEMVREIESERICAKCKKEVEDIRPQIEGVGICFECAKEGE